MPFLGQTTRLVVRAVKLDTCPSCGVTGIHAIALTVRWFDVLWMPVVRLEQTHSGNDHVKWPHCDHQKWPHPRPLM